MGEVRPVTRKDRGAPPSLRDESSPVARPCPGCSTLMPCEDTEAQRGCATSLRSHSQQRRSPGSGPGVAGPKLVFSMLICFGDSAGCLLGPQVGNGLKAAAGVGTDRLRQLWVRDNISPPYPFSACYQGGVLWKVSELGEHPSLQSPPHHPGNRFWQQRWRQLPCPEGF